MSESDYKYKCVQCDFYTNANSIWQKHITTEKHKTGERATRCDKKYPEVCDFCNYKPTGNTNYIQHKLNYHSSKEERKDEFKYYCENCDFGTFTKQIYEGHLKTSKHIKMDS